MSAKFRIYLTHSITLLTVQVEKLIGKRKTDELFDLKNEDECRQRRR